MKDFFLSSGDFHWCFLYPFFPGATVIACCTVVMFLSLKQVQLSPSLGEDFQRWSTRKRLLVSCLGCDGFEKGKATARGPGAAGPLCCAGK